MADELEEFTQRRLHFFQIDVMKTLMILLVIFDHILPYVTKTMLYIQFWLRLSVPVFLIIMGFNYGHSFQYKNQTTLREVYSKDYFRRKLRRYGIPFLVFFIPLTLIAIILEFFDFRLYSGRSILPFWGPGIWYVPVVFTAVLVIPMLYLLVSKRPHFTVCLCFASELIMHLLLYCLLEPMPTGSFTHDAIRFLFQSNILLYLSSIAMGLWFSTDHDFASQKHRFILIALPFSLIYLILYEVTGWRPFFIMSDYNFMMVPYAAVVFLIFMRLLPEKIESINAKLFAWTGRSTYHILLIQAVIFSVLYHFVPGMMIGEIVFSPETYLILCCIIITISLALGSTWSSIDRTYASQATNY